MHRVGLLAMKNIYLAKETGKFLLIDNF